MRRGYLVVLTPGLVVATILMLAIEQWTAAAILAVGAAAGVLGLLRKPAG
jgi:hypothetical protein